MKRFKNHKHEKKFDTRTLMTDINSVSENTKEIAARKDIAESEPEMSGSKKTQRYEPRPLTPDDDIYEDIIEQFASAPTKPKYWFEEFGDYWSCSCGHINKGKRCKSCGLERELLRSLFILHKPADAPGKLNKKLKGAKRQADKEALQQEEKEHRLRQREASGEDITKVVPIETEQNNDVKDNINEEQTDEKSPIKYTEISVAEITGTDKSKKRKVSLKIIIAIVVCLLLIGACGAAIYTHYAKPAMKYRQAGDLQKQGNYEKAIEELKALGDYENAQLLIWECYVSIGDEQYANGEFEEAIETYETAMEMDIAVDTANGVDLNDKIRQCYIAIGNTCFENSKLEEALKAYDTAMSIYESDDVLDKINDVKFSYVQTYKADRTAQVETYMSQLTDADYPGIQEVYDEYYAWHVNIIANTSEEDFSTDVETVSRKDTVYFHATLSGGEPSEMIDLYYEVTWPNGSSQIYELDSQWQDGSKITARFQYPIPLFGQEGELIFELYDQNTKELMGTDSVIFQH